MVGRGRRGFYDDGRRFRDGRGWGFGVKRQYVIATSARKRCQEQVRANPCCSDASHMGSDGEV